MKSPIIQLLSTEPRLLEIFTEFQDNLPKLYNLEDKKAFLEYILILSKFFGAFVKIVNEQGPPNEFKIDFDKDKFNKILGKLD